MGGQGLSHAERIRRRAEFERTYDTGVRVQGRFMTVFATPNNREVARFGVAATRKLGSAVERNRAKRLARELFRHHKIAGLDIVIVPRREMLHAPFTAVEADYLACLQRRDRERPGAARRQPRRGRRPRAASSV